MSGKSFLVQIMLENLHKISVASIRKAPVTQPDIYSLEKNDEVLDLSVTSWKESKLLTCWNLKMEVLLMDVYTWTKKAYFSLGVFITLCNFFILACILDWNTQKIFWIRHFNYMGFSIKEHDSTIRSIKRFAFFLEKLLFLSENPWSLDQIFHLGLSSVNTDSIQLLCGRILTNIVVAVAAMINLLFTYSYRKWISYP